MRGKLLSMGSTNPRPIGQVNITPKGERESFEAKLLAHTDPSTLELRKKRITRVVFALDHEGDRFRLHVPLRTEVKGRTWRIYREQDFDAILHGTREFVGHIFRGGNYQPVNGVIMLYESA